MPCRFVSRAAPCLLAATRARVPHPARQSRRGRIGADGGCRYRHHFDDLVSLTRTAAHADRRSTSSSAKTARSPCRKPRVAASARVTFARRPSSNGAKDGWSDVAFPTNRRGIPESVRDLGNRRGNLLRRALWSPARLPAKELRCKNRCRPGAKVLGGEVATGDLLQIIIHVRGCYRVPLAALIAVLK